MAPESLRLETKSQDGLMFVRVVGEWEQVYDKPESFKEYCPDEDKVSSEDDCCDCLSHGDDGCRCMCHIDDEEDNEDAPEPSFSLEELKRK